MNVESVSGAGEFTGSIKNDAELILSTYCSS